MPAAGESRLAGLEQTGLRPTAQPRARSASNGDKLKAAQFGAIV
jgi:hypothetical protein